MAPCGVVRAVGLLILTEGDSLHGRKFTLEGGLWAILLENRVGGQLEYDSESHTLLTVRLAWSGYRIFHLVLPSHAKRCATVIRLSSAVLGR